VDQVLSSGTNFVPSLLMARVLVPHDYGTFSLAYLAWFGALSVVVSALMQPYTLAASASEGEAWRDITRNASGAVVLVGGICSVIFILVGAIIGASSTLGLSFLVIALLAPGLVLQEFWRFASFAASRAKTAAANDGYWAIGQIVAFGILLATRHPTAPQCLLAWGAGAWLAAGLGIWQLSVMPRLNLAAIRWARRWGRVGAWFTLAGASFSLSMLIVAVTIGADFNRTAVGLFRIVQLLFGPVQLFTIAAGAVFMPHLVRVMKATSANGLRLVVLFSLLLVGLIGAYGLMLLVVAHFVLVTFFGAAYAGAAALVLPVLISYTIDAACSGADAHLRVRELGGRIAAVQLAAGIARVGAVAVLASLYGLRGAVWGLVVGSAVVWVGYWTQVLLTNTHTTELPDMLTHEKATVAHLEERTRSPQIVQAPEHSSLQ
jgi:O-antigen/teichoic acid export membrane protein